MESATSGRPPAAVNCALIFSIALPGTISSGASTSIKWLGAGQRLTSREQILQFPDHAVRFPFVHALAQQPHAVHIFQEANLAADSAQGW